MALQDERPRGPSLPRILAWATAAFLILPILVAPLCVPVLIFGVSASDAARGPMPLQSPLLILAALSLMAAAVGCIAAAAALRQPD